MRKRKGQGEPSVPQTTIKRKNIAQTDTERREET